MAIFTIGDLHLSLGTEKPMDIFKGWENYTQKLEENWREHITENDTVVVVGDISWAMKLEDTHSDFLFLDNLPGKKIMLKGNHDYWWQTKNKIEKYFEQCGFKTLSILFNNCFVIDDVAICGTRSWLFEDGEHNDKIKNRELGRLLASLEAAKAQNVREIVAFLHYPPISKLSESAEMIAAIQKFGVKRCYYGHLHGESIKSAVQGEIGGIDYKLISADALKFCPLKI